MMEDTEQKKLPATFTVPSYVMNDAEILAVINNICLTAFESDTGWSAVDEECVNSMVLVLCQNRGRAISIHVTRDGLKKFRFTN